MFHFRRRFCISIESGSPFPKAKKNTLPCQSKPDRTHATLFVPSRRWNRLGRKMRTLKPTLKQSNLSRSWHRDVRASGGCVTGWRLENSFFLGFDYGPPHPRNQLSSTRRTFTHEVGKISTHISQVPGAFSVFIIIVFCGGIVGESLRTRKTVSPLLRGWDIPNADIGVLGLIERSVRKLSKACSGTGSLAGLASRKINMQSILFGN